MKGAWILFLLLTSALTGEIQNVTVKWSPELCKSSCLKLLDQRFSKMKGVDSVKIDSGNGVMQLSWKKKVPFSYTDLDWNMRWIGLYMTYVRVSAKGKVVKKQKTYSIRSTDDLTIFELIGPATNPNPNLSVEVNSIFNRPLSPAVIADLEEALKKDYPVFIDGPLFEPWRGLPMRVVVGRVTLERPSPKIQSVK
jgi:hypothetical protein